MGVHIGGLVAVIVFYLLILAIGIWAARKTGLRIKNINSNEVMLAGRKIGLFVGCFTMTATWVGGGFINGSSEAVAGSGLVWCQAPVGYSLSLLIGGYFFAEKMRAREYNTMLDPYERKYGRFVSMLLYLPALCGEVFWSAAILNALGGTLAVILDLDPTISVIISAGVSLLYTLAGGLYSVAYTDVVQLILMFIGLWLCIPFAMVNDAVPAITTNSSAIWVKELTPSDTGVFVDTGLLLIFGGVPWQVYFQRVLSARSPNVAKYLSYVAAVGCVIMAIPAVLIGAIGAEADWNQTDYQGDVQENLSLVLPLVLRYLCPTWVGIIGLGAVSAAVMSSTDSSMLSASSMFSKNIFAPCYTMITSNKPSGTAIVWMMRFMQLIHAILACALAIKLKSIYVLFYLCSDLVYVMLFPQLTCAIFMKHSNSYGALAGFITGFVFRILGGDKDLGIYPIIKYPWYTDSGGQIFPFKTLSMLICLFTIVLVSYLAKFLFECGCLSQRLDVFQCFHPTSSSAIAEPYTDLDNNLNDMKEGANNDLPTYTNPMFNAYPDDINDRPILKYRSGSVNESISSRKSYLTKIEVKNI